MPASEKEDPRLAGDLGLTSPSDIVQTLAQSRMAGLLRVTDAEKVKELAFSSGRIRLVSDRTLRGFQLGYYLIGQGRITEEQLQIALVRQRDSGERLGQALVNLGICTEQDIRDALRYQAAEELYELFGWDHGSFAFLEGDPLSLGSKTSPFRDLEFEPLATALEAARRSDEWRELERGLPPSDMILLPATSPGLVPADVERDPAQAHLLRLARTPRTVGELLESSHLSPFDTARLLSGFYQRALLRPAELPEIRDAARGLRLRGRAPDAARLLERALRSSPRDEDLLREFIDCHEGQRGERELAPRLVELAKLLLGQGRRDEAVQLLDRATKVDLTAEQPLILLAEEYRGRGDLQSSARYLRTAAEILEEKGQIGEAIRICRQALDGDPMNPVLHGALANFHAKAGEPVNAVVHLKRLASFYDRLGNEAKVREIYRRVAQLDPTEAPALRDLEDRATSPVEAGGRGRKLAVLLVTIVILGGFAAWLGFGQHGLATERVRRAKLLLAAGRLSEAEKEVAPLLGNDGAVQTEVSGILDEIRRRRAEAEAEKEKLEDRFLSATEACISDADKHFGKGDDVAGLKDLSRLVQLFTSPRFGRNIPGISPERVKQVRAGYQKEVLSNLEAYERRVEEARTRAQTLLSKLNLEQLRLDAAPPTRCLDEIDRMREILTEEKFGPCFDTVREIGSTLRGTADEIADRLSNERALLVGLSSRLDTAHHQVRAVALEHQLKDDFLATRTDISDRIVKSDLPGAVKAAGEFMAECEKARAEEPRRLYEDMVFRVLGSKGLNLEGRMQSRLEMLKSLKKGYDEAEKLFADARIVEANRLLVGFGPGDDSLDLRPLLRLGTKVTTIPEGAKLFVSIDGGDEREVGVAGPGGLLFRYGVAERAELTARLDGYEDAIRAIPSGTWPDGGSCRLDLSRRPAWQVDLKTAVDAPPSWFGDTLVLATRGGRLVGISRDGKQKFDLDVGSLAGFASRPVGSGDHIYLAGLDGRVLDILPRDGKVSVLWRAARALRVPPVLARGRIYVTDDEGTTVALENGNVVWTREVGGRVKSATAASGKDLLVATTTGEVVALDLDTGAVDFRLKTGAPVRKAVQPIDDHLTLLATEEPELIAIDPVAGRIRWRIPLSHRAETPVAVVGSRLIVATEGGEILDLARETGEVTARRPISMSSGFTAGLLPRGDRFYTVLGGRRVVALSREMQIEWEHESSRDEIRSLLLGEKGSSAVTERGRVLFFSE